MSNPPADPNLWSTPEAAPPKKSKTLRNWLLGCSGCFVVAVLAFVVLIWMGSGFVQRKIEEAKDPLVAWGRVRAVLPYDVQPEQVEIKAAFSIMGLTNLTFRDLRNNALVHVMKMPNSDREGFDQLFDPKGSSNVGIFGIGAVEGAVAGELELQGRKARTLYFRGRSSGAGTGGGDGREMQQLRIDLSPPTGDQVLMHYMLSEGSPEALQAGAIEFLSDFKLGLPQSPPQ